MATLDLFESMTDDDARHLLELSKSTAGRQEMRHAVGLATAYLNGQQRADVTQELQNRYPSRQVGPDGEQIATQTLPLAQRYADEAATAYNREVSRTLTLEDGTENESTKKATDELRAMLDDVSYDLTMHAVEKNVLVSRTAGLWYQARGGKLSPQVVTADNLYPIEPDEKTWFDQANQDDYRAHSVRLSDDDRWAIIEPAQTGFYRGKTFHQIDGTIQWFNNPYRWPQRIDTDDGKGSEMMLPLQPLTYWHRDKTVPTLIPDIDAEIAYLNREINLQWSIIMDTIAHQGWAQAVFNLINPEAPPQNTPSGSAFAYSLGIEESASMLSSPIQYNDIVTALGTFVRTMALALRQSPNDFSIEGQKALSGFAKLIDSLPKIEARLDRIAVLETQEANLAWPRLAAIGSFIGKLSSSVESLSKLRLKTSFADIKVPLSTQERLAQEQHDIQLGITTPAKILASREGISEDDAQEIIDDANGTPSLDDSEGLGAGGDIGAGPAGDDVQKTVLNGAQITSMVDTVRAVAAGEIPRDSAIAVLRVGFMLSEADAAAIVAQSGTPDFVSSANQPKPTAPQPAAGGAGQQTNPEPAAPAARRGQGNILSGLIGRRRGQGDGES